MADFVSKEKRSKIMRGVKSKNTKPEMKVRSLLHRLGYRFRIHKKDLPGKPDICLPKYNTIIFVNGCFWHFHEKCGEGRLPKTNTDFWENKIRRNIERDLKNQEGLRELGWNVQVIWECETKDIQYLKERITNMLN